VNTASLEYSEIRVRVARLRDRAQHCLAMAERAHSSAIAAELASIARDYERDAQALELEPGRSAAA